MFLLIILLILGFLSFFFSASETSLIAISKLKAMHMVKKGIKGSQIVFKLITQTDKVISAILVGNNFVNIAISSIVTAAFVAFMEPPWDVIFATLSVAVFVLIFCEIIPKTLAIRYSERVSLISSPFLVIFIRTFEPLFNLFNSVSDSFLRLFGIHKEKRVPLINEEELKLMIEIGKDEGVLSDEERKMLHRIFEFGDTRVSEVMIPKEKIIAIDKTASSERLLDILVEEGHARIPVYESSIENIIGVIYARDLLYIWRNKGLIVFSDLIYPVHYVPSDKRVNELLREFQLKRIQIAVVTDNSKKAVGMVTLEDLLEEIVGEIEEERRS